VDPNKADKMTGNVASTVVIAEFPDRRNREMVRDEAKTDEALAPGTKLGRYLIVERLGGGGMGVVYKAQDTELHRTVALKVLPPHLCRQAEYLNRFRAEAQAQARLNSPYVTMLYSLLELPAGEVLVLEYSAGQTLEQRIKGAGPLAPDEAAGIFDQALRAVEHTHAMGVVHRDLKPGNLFITSTGRVKLMDFGVAKLMDQPDHTTHRTMVGTLLYISPEQINGYATDFRSDVYTLGVSLFEAVTGRLPFERRTDYALMHAHVQERPPRPKDLQRGIPPALETVILRAIEKDPERRFQSAAEFRKSLLKLGLIERRKRTLSVKAASSSEAGRRKEDSVANGPTSRSLLGGLWLDMALVATVAGLVYTLDIYPAKPPVTPTPAAVAGAADVNVKRPVPAARRTHPPAAPNTAPDTAENRYDALREAWGN
jgi:eukaryotic-like serine/threonine-protein kinase